MKQIAQDLTISTQPTRETERQPDSTRAMTVWVQLAELFGKAHYRENGDVPSNLWNQALSRLTNSQISTGLANLGNDGLTFPANLSQFIAACKREKMVRQLGVKLLPMSDTEKEANAERAWRDMEKLAGRKLRSDA